MSVVAIGHTFHRVVVFAVALWYVSISLQTFLASVTVLRGLETQDLGLRRYESHLINGYAGTGAIRDSPLVQQVLQGSTLLRQDSIYLLTNATYSFSSCSPTKSLTSAVYANPFLRFLYNSLKKYARTDLAYLDHFDLVAPVVDCTFDLLATSEEAVTQLRLYFLARHRSNTSAIVLLSALVSTQDFQVLQQYQSGAALVATIASIEDMRALNVTHHFAIALNYPYELEPQFLQSELLTTAFDHFWVFRSHPLAVTRDAVKEVRTAFRYGCYIDDPIAQSNIETVTWHLPSDPASEVRNWEWRIFASLRDSWAWTHGIHGIFAGSILFDLSVLFFVVYDRFCRREYWVGDAFATISSSIVYRGVLVFVSNYLNGFWTLTEFCLALGNELGGRHSMHYRPELVHADLLTLFLNLSCLFSYVLRERIDPVLAFVAFELVFTYRLELLNATRFKHTMVDFAETDYWQGLINVSPSLANLSPMKFRTIHSLKSERTHVIFITVFVLFSPLVGLVAWMAVHKGFRYVQLKREERAQGEKYADKQRLSRKANQLTSFETATGSALSKRYGVICGYDNYVLLDDQRYASIDAVYGNGYLVANRKFLIATEDLLSLFVMKITRIRFRNIFVYLLLKDKEVKQTAELVYPPTISWADLAQLGVTHLA